VAGLLELPAARGDRVGVRKLELDACLRRGDIGRPLRRAETGLGRLPQRPDAEVLDAVDVLAVNVAVVAGQRQAERVDVELLAGGRVGDRRTRFRIFGANRLRHLVTLAL